MNEHVEEAVKSFSLTEMISGTAKAPTDSVVVYLDADGAYKIEAAKESIYELQKEAGRLEHSKGNAGPTSIDEESPGTKIAKIQNEIESLEADIDEYQEAMTGSALRITLRGMNDPEREVLSQQSIKDIKIPKGASDEDKNLINHMRQDQVMSRWVGRSVVSIRRENDGAETKGPKDLDGILELKTALYDSEWNKLLNLFNKLSLSSSLIDQAVDAGFRSGASVQAGE